jgi:hypothetical protein
MKHIFRLARLFFLDWIIIHPLNVFGLFYTQFKPKAPRLGLGKETLRQWSWKGPVHDHHERLLKQKRAPPHFGRLGPIK